MPRWTHHVLGVAMSATVLFACATAATADEEQAKPDAKTVCPICHNANNQAASYPDKAVSTLERGAANTLLGWTEIIRQPATEAKSGGNVLAGLGKGVTDGVKRTLGGLGELFTFWTPKVENRYIHFADDCPICMGMKQQQAEEAAKEKSSAP